MAETSAESPVEIKDGKLINSKVTDKVNSKFEKGVLVKVSALIVHQT